MHSKKSTVKHRSHFTVRSSVDRRTLNERRRGRDINYFIFGGTPRRTHASCRRAEQERRRNRPIDTMEQGLVSTVGLDKEGMFPTPPEV